MEEIQDNPPRSRGRKRAAFTLAEVLITLGIIGVVAAMTIPTINSRVQEARTINQLKATKSIIAQAFRGLLDEYGEPAGWGITGNDAESAQIIGDKLKFALKLALDCGLSDAEGRCAPKVIYKLLNGNDDPNGDFAMTESYYKMVLTNGAHIYIRGVNETGKMMFYVDVNGNAAPNMFGRDFFQFVVLPDGGVFPSGDPDPKVSSAITAASCAKDKAGYGCAYYVLHNGNMNYLH